MNINKTFIIAEAGVNHNGSIKIAKQLIDEAVRCGVDAIKFQTFKAENLVSKKAKKCDYQIENTDQNESQFEMIKKLELSKNSHIELINYCKMKNILFLSTPFDSESANLLRGFNMPIYKIPSGEITNLPLLEYIGSFKKPIIMSSGMSTLKEVDKAIDILIKAGSNINDITILHCNSEYPSPYEDVNLTAMITIKNKLGVNIGYSDHTLGIEIPIAAVALGAKVIEKHFTLDRNLEGPDHKASLEPNELKNMVLSIRNIEIAMGNGIKKPTLSETKNIISVRKSIIAKKNIKKGDIFTNDNLTTKRPGSGLSPLRWYDFINKKSDKNYQKDDLIKC